MNEHEFILKLQQRASEQQRIIKGMLFPKLFTQISIWLGDNPYRVLIPLAFLFSLILHFSFGKGYDNLILKIFGGISIVKLLIN